MPVHVGEAALDAVVVDGEAFVVGGREVEDGGLEITLVGLGYTDDEQSRKLREFFVAGNKFSIAKLKVALEKN